MRRVAVTGIGGLSPIGNDWASVEQNLRSGRSGVASYPLWSDIKGLRAAIAGQVRCNDLLDHYDRKKVRTMSRAALLATRATEVALSEAGLLNSSLLTDGSTGIAYGSCLGGPDALMHLAAACINRDMKGVPATSYVKAMSHSCAASVGIFFGFKGRLIPTCSACTSGSQGLGFAYEAIKHGQQKIMIAGGAEELSIGLVGLFDSMLATSVRNDAPTTTPRPFDSARDGLVVSEGACSFVLEDYEHALARGVKIIAELVGFGTNCDGAHITNPEPTTMAAAMRLSLSDARIRPDAVRLVHAHATATETGDIAESKAAYEIFRDNPNVTALKSYTGHTLGAAGALEAWFTIEMMNAEWVAPIKNLESVDERCAPLNYVIGRGREVSTEFCMSNNFAFGGVNTSLIFRRIS